MPSKEKNSDYDNYDFSGDFEVRDERESGRFYLDDELIDDMGAIIGGDAVAVYAAIVRHGRRSNQSARPGLKRIAKKLDYSKQHVINQIKRLESQNMVHVIRRRVQSGQNLTNVYVLKNRKVWGGSPQHGLGVVHDIAGGSPQHGLEPKELNQKNENKTSPPHSEESTPDPLVALWEQIMGIPISNMMFDRLKEWGDMYSVDEVREALVIAHDQKKSKHTYILGILRNKAADKAKQAPPQQYTANAPVPPPTGDQSDHLSLLTDALGGSQNE